MNETIIQLEKVIFELQLLKDQLILTLSKYEDTITNLSIECDRLYRELKELKEGNQCQTSELGGNKPT